MASRFSERFARLFSRTSSAPSAAVETERETRQGAVVGLVADNGAHVWRGIPYAASTAGANRWRAPQPAPTWSGVREALEFAERCAQLTNEFDKNEGLEPGLTVGSEDCLALDIYAPANARGRSLPVMVWIHPGGNVWGRSSKYDGARLAHNEDVLVVAVQHRVGPLGWFAHEALRACAETLEDAAACFATLDLIASLRWIRDNIGEFGGDPGCVTILGESAGGHNVATLLASPLAKGLFHRAIVQSGSFDSTPLTHAEGLEGELLNPSRTIADKLGAHTAEALRAVPVDALLAAYTRGRGFVDVPRVIEDGVVLPSGPLINAFASRETFNTVPIMVGATRDEMKLFYLSDDRFTRRRLGIFVVARDQAAFDALTGYVTRAWRVRAVNEPAALITSSGHDAVYTYRFDWDDGGRILFMDFKKMFGAAHGFDIPFVFNHFHHLGDADRVLFQPATLEARERLSRVMGAYWASFARTGVPSCAGAPAWPAFGDGEGACLRLDVESDGGVEVYEQPDTLERLIADLSEETRVDRCLVVREIGKWMFGKPIAERLRSATGCE